MTKKKTTEKIIMMTNLKQTNTVTENKKADKRTNKRMNWKQKLSQMTRTTLKKHDGPEEDKESYKTILGEEEQFIKVSYHSNNMSIFMRIVVATFKH